MPLCMGIKGFVVKNTALGHVWFQYAAPFTMHPQKGHFTTYTRCTIIFIASFYIHLVGASAEITLLTRNCQLNDSYYGYYYIQSVLPKKGILQYLIYFKNILK